MSEGELPYIREARAHLAKLNVSFDQLAKRANNLHASDKEATARIADLQRRLDETEQRALTAENTANDLRTKAERGVRLDEAAVKLVEALDRLPVSMDEANLVPGVSKPSIALYGTYEWQAVIDAKFHIKQELLERRRI